MKQQLPLLDLLYSKQNNIIQNNSEEEGYARIKDKKKYSSGKLPSLKNNPSGRNLPNIYDNKPMVEIKEIDEKINEEIINNLNINDFNLNNDFQEDKGNNKEYKEYRRINSNEEKEAGKKTSNILMKQSLAATMKIEDIKKKNEELLRKKELEKNKSSYRLRKKLELLVDHNIFVMFFMGLTIFVMFIGDIQNGWLTGDVDVLIDVIQIIIFFLFSLEIVLNCFAKEGYTNSFFFWLDVVSTLSLITDIGIIFNPMLNLGSQSAGDNTQTLQIQTETTNNSTNVIASGNKGLKTINATISKITAISRITRVLRVIRVIRLVRIVKLYKSAMLARENILKRKREQERLKNMKKPSIDFTNPESHPLGQIDRRSSKNQETSDKRDSDPNNKLLNNYIHFSNIIFKKEEDINVHPLHHKEIKQESLGLRLENVETKRLPSILASPRKTLRKSTLRTSASTHDKRLKFLTEEKRKAQEESAEKAKAEKKNKQNNEITLENLTAESKTSKIITESITKKVILLILSILIVLAVLEDSFYTSEDTISYNIVAKYLSNYLTIYSNDADPYFLPEKLNNSFWEIINNESDDKIPIVNMTIYQNTYFVNPKYQDYPFRNSELGSSMTDDVTVATVYFENDVKRLVLDPLEVMIEIIDKVSKNPIKAKNFENLETGMKTTISKMNKSESVKPTDNSETTNNQDKNKKNINKTKARKKGEEYEVKIIQSAIMKISALLAIGIGEAGNDIIKQNLSNKNDLDPMVKGRKKSAIFGFCDIRGFPLVNESLQENTMVFVNEIADIVHSSVDLFNGSTNKNIGDAFLTVWKLPSEFEKMALHETKESDFPPPLMLNPIEESNSQNRAGKLNTVQTRRNIGKIRSNLNLFKLMDANLKVKFDETNLKPNPLNEADSKITTEINKIADSAVFGFLKIIIKINRELRILAYRRNEEILNRIEDFKVNMGFGLHMGWAIEGAIGSKYKIDASYLSPNVNMAARLEAATRQYGVSLLISGPLYDLLSEDVKAICRLIDIVTVKGSIKPVKFYTIDINENLKPSKKFKKDFSEKEVRIKQIDKKKQIKQSTEIVGLAAVILNKKHFRRLLKNPRPKSFYKCFNNGFEKYIDGNWEAAASKFEEGLKIFPSDGPTNTLLKYMRENNCTAPSDWKGYRALTSK